MDQQAKEQGLFTSTSEFADTLVYFELSKEETKSERTSSSLINESSDKINENAIKDLLKETSVLNELIQNLFVLNGDKSLLISAKSEASRDSIETVIQDLFGKRFKRKPVPHCYANTRPVYLVSELTDEQLNVIDPDKYSAIKLIEAKTGLRLKKIKKSIYFGGLLFQFLLLDELLSEKSKEIKVPLAENKSELATELLQQPNEKSKERHPSKEFFDWQTLFKQSEIRYNFKLRPKMFENVGGQGQFEYDVYIFQADLTDLNTDALVNASNPVRTMFCLESFIS
jgi:hypothetical protein